ncbi:hypothetical protein P12x_005313 [Tundrisphaera lichenicola]|uniref:hypothetical protein n=1 Tax=Tundrisphaera lichenicola TaxID=2029860 RepID=UPI003EC0082F
MILAAELCDQAGSADPGHNSLFVVPWLSLATCPSTPVAPSTGAGIATHSKHLTEQVLATRYQLGGRQLNYLLGECICEMTERAYRVKARNTVAALRDTAALAKKGAYTHYLHQHALNMAALTLLDYNSDSLSIDQFALLTNATVTEVRAYTDLVRLLSADDSLLVRYDQLISRIQATAVSPGIDEELSRRRDLLRKTLKDSSDKIARAAGDLFENYDTVPTALRERIELYVPVR